ncbi:MAG TPA: hypothetical protein VK137_10430 [Planctomycetaceae bacterium]|nr:hypothetical protein [Planctomycetaceae bacterium]
MAVTVSGTHLKEFQKMATTKKAAPAKKSTKAAAGKKTAKKGK